jgi:hypothetical protein
MNAAVDILNPTGERFYLYTQNIINDGAPANSTNRIYLNHTPQLEKGQLVGLASTLKNTGVIASNPNISPLWYDNANNLDGFFGISYSLFLTIVNKNNEILFENIPYNTLFPLNGKIHKYNAVNIDTRKSYFSFAAGTLPGGFWNASLIFIMNYQ